MDAFMDQMRQSENQYYNQAVSAASVFGSPTFKYPEFNLTPFTYTGDKKMAKKVLTTEQKAAITYGRARGLTDIQIADLYAVAKLTPGNIDDMISFAKLLDDYDPSEDDEDDS